MVPGTPQAQEALFGIDCIFKGLPEGKLAIDMSFYIAY